MAAARKPGPQCSYNHPVDIDDGTMCIAPSPRSGSLGIHSVVSVRVTMAKSVALMTHEEKIGAAIHRARDHGLISKEALAQLPSMQQFVVSIVAVSGLLTGLGVTAGLVASTGVGAVVEGIAAAIVLALSALGIITSAAQIVTGIKTLMRFYDATRKARTYPGLDAAGRDFARGIAEVGVGTFFMILSVLGARKGIKMGGRAASKWSGRNSPPPESLPPNKPPPEESESRPTKPLAGAIDESARPFSPKERALAQTLAKEGKNVQSVPESTEEGVRTPDALVDGNPTEFKSLDPGANSGTVKNTVGRSIGGTGQARDIVIDARGSGLDVSEAQRGLARVGGIANGKLDGVRIIGDGYDVQSSY